ncbi:MAG: hypothetical protein IJ565_04525 [Bacilli bacterium]|nr:hypothetical protein [Bacilli bacterium]
MLRVNDELRKYDLSPSKYTNLKNVTIVDTNKGKFVFKRKTNNNIYDYLNSRNFNYYPKIISDSNDEFMITPYIPSIDMPEEQKIDDMIDLVSLLHSKTTHFKEVDSDEYKEIYEDITNNIDYLYSYYSDIMTIIESKVFMSPPEYLLALNISKVYESLSYCHIKIEDWYKKVKDKKKKRLVVLHNNLKLDHFIRYDIPYLISWDKAKIDMPIFDLYKLYKNENIEFDFSEVLKRYEHNYPLDEDEKELLFILITLPDKISFDDTNYNMCIKISDMIDILNRAKYLTSPNNFKNTEKN